METSDFKSLNKLFQSRPDIDKNAKKSWPMDSPTAAVVAQTLGERTDRFWASCLFDKKSAVRQSDFSPLEIGNLGQNSKVYSCLQQVEQSSGHQISRSC